MINPDLLEILCCPESHQSVALAEPSLVESLNQQIGAGRVQTRGGQTVTEPIEAGLIRADRKYVYPIRQGIPNMLIDEAIPLA